jgi:hypothetical protein
MSVVCRKPPPTIRVSASPLEKFSRYREGNSKLSDLQRSSSINSPKQTLRMFSPASATCPKETLRIEKSRAASCPERSFLFLPLTFNICDHSGVAIAFFTSCNIDMNTRLRRCVFMPCGCMSSLRDFLRACSYQSYSFPGACCPCRVLTVLSGHEACYLVRTRHGTGSG